VRRRPLLGAVVLAACVVVPAPGAGAGAGAAAQAPAGEIVDFQILPPELTVQVGDTITWTNGGQRPHTVTDRGGMFDTNPILPGEQASVAVTVPGTYEVFCRINPSTMNARVVVEPGPEPPSVVRIQALDDAREGETLRFEPADLEIALGAQLILANVGGLPHSLRTDDGSLRIPVVEPGAEQGRFAGGNGAVTVTEPGTYGFFCDIHPEVMRGTLVVTDTRAEAEERAPPATAASSTSLPPAGDVQAEIVEFAYDPTEIAVEPGSTTTWRNAGDVAHTVTFDDLDIDLGPIEPGETASATAPGNPGSYSYYCSIHPQQLRGVLLVRAPAVAVAATSAADEPADGTVFAYALGLLFIATAVAGLALWHRHA
jgi:plastocyanin